MWLLADWFHTGGQALSGSMVWTLLFCMVPASCARSLSWGSVKRWDILLGEDATASERHAAVGLQAFLRQAGGTELAIDDAAHGTPGIFLGPNAVTRAGGMAFDARGLGPEDLRVVVQTNGIAIAGGPPRGTLYGVYSFLEDVLGVRFLTPDQTYVPSLHDRTRLPLMDRTYRPPFRFRWSYFGEIAQDHLFATRMRTNTVQTEDHLGGKTPINLVSHTFGHLMPWATYGAQHPEYYNETDGERPKDIWNDQYDPGVQLCTTNPEVVRIVSEAVLQDLAVTPGTGNISVSQNDNSRKCECERCRAVDEREGSHIGSLLTLVNAVADAVAKSHPGVMVGTLAYDYSRKPPTTIRPRPNVQIQLCSIECCQTHPIDDPDCPKNRAFCEDLRGWSKICDNVYVWTYVTNFHNYLIPCPNLRALGQNIRFFHANDVKGLFMQGPAAGAELGGLRNYIISNMIWDPTRDETALMDEFLRLHYGRAARLIRQYIDLVHDAAERNGQHRNCFGSAAEHGLSADLGRAALRTFQEAMKVAESDEVRKRVEKASIAGHALIVEAAASPAFQKVRSRKKTRDPTPFVSDPAVSGMLRPQLAIFFDLCRRHGVPRMGEWASIDEVADVLREGYGMQKGEPFQ